MLEHAFRFGFVCKCSKTNSKKTKSVDVESNLLMLWHALGKGLWLCCAFPDAFGINCGACFAIGRLFGVIVWLIVRCPKEVGHQRSLKRRHPRNQIIFGTYLEFISCVYFVFVWIMFLNIVFLLSSGVPWIWVVCWHFFLIYVYTCPHLFATIPFENSFSTSPMASSLTNSMHVFRLHSKRCALSTFS